MWDITLQVLSVIGNILLFLLALILLLTLLFLFFPVVYRLEGKKTPEEVRVSAGAGWLFGLLRLKFAYPEPGKLTVKILWKTVFDSSQRKEKGETGKRVKKKKSRKASGKGRTEKPQDERQPGEDGKTSISGEALNTGKGTEPSAGAEAVSSEESTEPPAGAEAVSSGESTGSPASAETVSAGENPELSENGELPGKEAAGDEGDGRESRTDGKTGILEKAGKIKYTIQKICDKIREVWENISYYTQLLQEENTARLWQHVRLRLGKILRSIRPRHIRADLLFGAASPDTTGYVYGFYCMFSPALGETVTVTPDFTQAVFQGEAEVSGCVTGAVLVWNALRLLLDRKLHLFLKKMKAGRKRDGR